MKSFKNRVTFKNYYCYFLGILFSWFMPESIARLFVTFNLFFSNFFGICDTSNYNWISGAWNI